MRKGNSTRTINKHEGEDTGGKREREGRGREKARQKLKPKP